MMQFFFSNRQLQSVLSMCKFQLTMTIDPLLCYFIQNIAHYFNLFDHFIYPANLKSQINRNGQKSVDAFQVECSKLYQFNRYMCDHDLNLRDTLGKIVF